MVYDPNWTTIPGPTTGPTHTSVTPRNPWTVLTPVAVGTLDVDFVLKVRANFPAFTVRSDQPVRITSTPMVTP